MMASDYRKKKRGRKPNASKMRAVVAEEIKSFPATDFEKFMANLKSEPKKSEEENERESLIFKINKLKLEIENLKELKAVQSLRKSNILLHIDVLKMKYNQLMADEAQASASNPPPGVPSSSKDSINIKNVIYNNCAQALSERNKKQAEDNNSNYDPNFTYIASQLLSFFSDKMDANFATHVDSIKNYTHQIFKNEIENLKNEKRVSPIKIKLDSRSESVESDNDSAKKYVIAEKSNKCARKKTSGSSAAYKPPPPPPKSATPSPPPSPSPPPVYEPPVPPVSKSSPKKKDLKFEFDDIKVKILEYLCGKVDSNIVVSAFRRLQRSKAYAMLRQTFDVVHNRLLRVYLFEDNNILVQDMTICKNEFSKDMYHSIRYYAIILTTKDGDAVQEAVFETPEPKTKQVEAVPKHCLRSGSKGDLIILQPCSDNIPRQRFKVDMVQDTMIYEEFELVSRTPFVIRPIFSEVVLSSAQLDLLKPLILKALSTTTQGMPVISIVPKSANTEVLQDYGRESNTNLFLIKNENPAQANYSLSKIKSVVTLPEANRETTNIHTTPQTKQPAVNKRKQDLSKVVSNTKKTKVEESPRIDDSISFVSVDDIIKGFGSGNKPTSIKFEPPVDIQETSVKEENVFEDCIDLSDDEEEAIIIN